MHFACVEVNDKGDWPIQLSNTEAVVMQLKTAAPKIHIFPHMVIILLQPKPASPKDLSKTNDNPFYVT